MTATAKKCHIVQCNLFKQWHNWTKQQKRGVPRKSSLWICFLFDTSLRKQPRHDAHKACCYYSPRSCRVNPYTLTWPLNDIHTEIEIPFFPPKWELHADIWYVAMSSIHRRCTPATVRIFYLFILSLECYCIVISSFLLNTQPRFCMSTFYPLLSARSLCLMHRWCEAAEALRLAADSPSILLAFQVLDQHLELNWDEWLVKEMLVSHLNCPGAGTFRKASCCQKICDLGVIFCWTH